MQITLSYTICSAYPWKHSYDCVGEYSLKQRKTPDEVKAEKQFNKENNIDKKVKAYSFESRTVYQIEDDTCYFLIGSWSRLKAELDRRGEKYDVVDKRDPILKPEPDYTALKDVEFRPGQLEAIASIASSDCGLICSSVGFGKSFIIKQLCKIYPKTNILIVCPAGEVVKELFRDINKEIPGEVGILNMDSTDISGKRIIVTTCKSMHKIRPEQVQLMLVDEAHGTGEGAYGFEVMHFSFCRRFGFTATPIRNSGDYKFFESLYGPVLQNISYSESEANGSVTPINYCMLSIGRTNQMLEDKTDLQDWLRNKLYYWHNRDRNNTVVNTFYELKRLDPEAQILIMTQSLEHLIRLAEKIPGIKWMHGERGNLEKYRKAKDLKEVNLAKYQLDAKGAKWVKHCLETGEYRYCISTGCLSAGVNLKHLKYLIRVDGASSGIPSVQIPGRLARLDDNKDCAYLIDFADDFCTNAERRAVCREKEYRKQGWKKLEFSELVSILNSNNLKKGNVCLEIQKENRQKEIQNTI